MKVLFICNQNEHRSKTAEEIFQQKFTTRSAGLFNTSPIEASQMDWADVVVVMEDFQRTELAKRFPHQYLVKRIVSLHVPDVFSYGQPELKALLKERMAELF